MQLTRTLSLLNDECSKVIELILDQRVEEVSNILDRIRLYRSTIRMDFTTSLEQLKKSSDAKTENETQKIEVLLNKFQEKMNIIEEWLHRDDNNKSYEELIKTKSGIDYIVDAFIPLSWNYNRDLIFLYTDFGFELIPNLVKRGQSNIVYLTEKYKDIANVYCIKDIEQLRPVLLKMQRKPRLCVYIEPIIPDDPRSQNISNIQSEIDKSLKLLTIGVNTYNKFSKDWVEQKIENLGAMVHAFDTETIRKVFQDNPVIIVNPGPSLKEDISKINSVRDNVVIVAPTQSVHALTSHNISPDILVMIDSGNYVKFLDGLDTSRLKAFVFYDVVKPEMFAIFPNIPKIVISTTNDILDNSDIIPMPDFTISGASVSVVALKLAVGLGSKVIGLMGQDLAIGKGSYYMDSKSKDAKKQLSNNPINDEADRELKVWGNLVFHDGIWRQKIEVLSNSGGKTITTPGYWSYLLEIEEFISENEKNVKIFNFSLNGAKIEDIEYVPFKRFSRDFLSKKINQNFRHPNLHFLQINNRIDIVNKKLNFIHGIVDSYISLFTKLLLFIKKSDSKNISLYEDNLRLLSRKSLLMDLYFQRNLHAYISLSDNKKDQKKFSKDLYLFYSSLKVDAVRLRRFIRNLKKNLE